MKNEKGNSNTNHVAEMMKSKGNAKRFWVAFLIQALVFATSLIVSIRLSNTMMDDCWSTLNDAAQTTDSHVNNLLTNYYGAIQNMVREVTTSDEILDPHIVGLFQQAKLGALQSSIRLYLPDGSALTEKGYEQDISDRVKYADIYSEHVYISTLHQDIYDSESLIIEQFVPVNKNGNIIGMISAIVNSDALQQELNGTNAYGGKAYVLLVDSRDGMIIVDTDHMTTGSLNMQRKSVKGYDFEAFKNDVMNRKQSYCAIVSERSGATKYLYSIPSSILYWNTIVEVDEDVAFVSVHEMNRGITAILGAEITCFMIYIIWLWRNLKSQYLFEVKMETEQLKKDYEKDSLLYQRAILDNAYSYFKVNLTQNKVISPIIERVNGEPVDFSGKYGEKLPDYDQIIFTSADLFVDNDYKQEYKSKLSKNYLIGQHIDGNMMPEFITKIYSSIIGWHYRKYVSYLSEDPETNDILCMNVAYDISDEIVHEQSEKDQRRIIEALADDYECLVRLNLERAHVDFYRVSDNFKKLREIWKDGVADSDRIVAFIKEFVADEDVQRFIDEAKQDRLIEATKSGKPFRVNCRLKIKGESKWYQLKYVNHTTTANEHCVIAAYRNIDDEIRRQNKHQEEMEQALKKAEDANKAKTHFLFNMSHDIRTPMNAVIGFADLAEKNIDDKEKMMGYLEKLRNSSKQLLNIINDVLEVSRIESGQIKLNLQPFDMRKGCKGLNPIFEPLFKEKNLQIDLHGSGRDYFVLADYQRLNRIIFNVLSNAVKYTPPGGLIRYIIEQVEDLPDGRVQYQWTISDNGMGMSKEYLDKIYERFTREKSTTESGIEGTGLGMSMVKDFVDMMDGHINITSEVGKGTTVVIRIPFQKCAEDLVKMLEGPSMNSLISMKGKKILIVEDIEINREIAVEMLEDEGIICLEAENGQQAVEIVENAKPGDIDMILMDIQMPIMNGYDATKKIRTLNSPYANIPIVAMTANAFEEDRQEALGAGMNEHLAKPVTAEKLRTVISRYL